MVFLAHAEAHVAEDKGDLNLAIQAVQHATEAENYLNDNPFSSIVLCIYGYLPIFRFSAIRGFIGRFRETPTILWGLLKLGWYRHY